jgi:hypothetical protein
MLEGDRTKPLKYKVIKITGLGLEPPVLSASGLPSVDVNSLHILTGEPAKGKYGKAFKHFE